ncbi:uncharacterized protein LOC144486488 [Mustelus asterias]
MEPQSEENTRGKIHDILGTFDRPHLLLVLRHMLIFKELVLFKASGIPKSSRQRINDLLRRCDDKLLAFLFNQFLIFRKDFQGIVPSSEKDHAKTHRQNFDHLLDQADDRDLRAFEQIILSYVSIVQATPADREANPREVIGTALDQLDALSLKAILQHLIIFREHSEGAPVQVTA